ncbi:sugar transferase [Primorskyibacter sp. S187A]|uniref:sugar transferase n=1 Tax=Primorskyibacter sp. S187A TaxID=3415130 RepID=UPI003C7BEC45
MTMQLRQPYSAGDYEFDLARDARAPNGVYRSVFKRAFDLAIVALLALPVMTVVLICALLVLARDGANPFYRQKRIGLNGEHFWMWKLRSMVPNADKELQGYLAGNADARAEWEHSQKLRVDPRVTPIGQFLRKSSFDELPQLFNVFRGDMSIVGPRPMMTSQRSLYPGTAYYAMRPGITGYWQISVRNECGFSERAFYDTAYFCDLSFFTDLKVLWRTVHVVLRGTGC